ncbi:hypothetical protein BDV96DRAFT_603897 [Lophiotrema nucula]|uniref:Uncharacterized protein n=1 Tax=Lophiotrema nucula TaxID=690887 RepID=A0A6A5YW13_9PLEO|nr:hypothetical protein BDV96DRAFT_603897 [Lophiotrema nucula]
MSDGHRSGPESPRPPPARRQDDPTGNAYDTMHRNEERYDPVRGGNYPPRNLVGDPYRYGSSQQPTSLGTTGPPRTVFATAPPLVPSSTTPGGMSYLGPPTSQYHSSRLPGGAEPYSAARSSHSTRRTQRESRASGASRQAPSSSQTTEWANYTPSIPAPVWNYGNENRDSTTNRRYTSRAHTATGQTATTSSGQYTGHYTTPSAGPYQSPYATTSTSSHYTTPSSGPYQSTYATTSTTSHYMTPSSGPYQSPYASTSGQGYGEPRRH